MFCPKCKGLMFPSQGNRMRCKKCGNEIAKAGHPTESISISNVEVDEYGKPLSPEEQRPKDIAIIEDAQTLPTCREECPKCHHNEATYYFRQTRKSDEPPTRFYRCTKCGNSWRGY